MAKLLKIVGRILGIIWEWLLLVLIIFAFSIRTSTFQTYLGGLATDYLSKELHTELHIGKIDIVFFDKVFLKNVFVRDLSGDTLANLSSIDLRIEDLGLSGSQIVVKSVSLNEGRVGISRDSIHGDYNYEFIVDFFDSGSKENKDKKSQKVLIRGLSIDHVDLSYDDYRKGYSEYGMDFDHLYFHNLVLQTDNISINGSKYVFNVRQISTIEQSGFYLNTFKANAKVDLDKGVFLKNLEIRTSRSKLFAPHFYLEMDGINRIYEFEDSVYFDAQLDSSVINMRDVAIFAPSLKGMNEPIFISAKVTNRVKDLTIKDLDLSFGQKTMITGDFLLPDFRNLENGNLNEKIRLAYIDLKDVQKLRLPDDAMQKFIQMDPMILRLGYADLRQTTIKGTVQKFRFQTERMNTALGTVHVDNGILFTELPEGGYRFNHSANSNFDIYVDSFQLDKFIDDDLFGKVNGSLFLSGVVGQKDIFRIDEMNGQFNSFGFNNYNYSNITVDRGLFKSNILDAKISINDPHLILEYEGQIDVSKNQHFDFKVDLARADIGKLNFVNDPNATFLTNAIFDIRGTSLENYSGRISCEKIAYQENGKVFALPGIDLRIDRGETTDHFQLSSEVIDATLDGKINPNTLKISVNNLLVDLLPAYFSPQRLPKGKTNTDYFHLDATVGKADEVLAIFSPQVSIAPQTNVVLDFDARSNRQTMRISSSELAYQAKGSIKQFARNVVFADTMVNGTINAYLDASSFKVTDSLFANNLDIDIIGQNGDFDSRVKWNQGLVNPADIHFTSAFPSKEEISVVVKESNFSVRNQVWNVNIAAAVNVFKDKIEVNGLKLERGEEFLDVDGIVSKNEEDELHVKANAINLADFSSILNLGAQLEGKLNGDIKLTTPFTDLRADGEVQLLDLFVNKQEVGDIHSHGIWDDRNERLVLDGDLFYKDYKTFKFEGFLYPTKEENNLDFTLNFDNMDLGITNAFLDPTVISDIKGKLKGRIDVKGSMNDPDISGDLKLINGGLKVGILGTRYDVSGPLEFDGDNDGIYCNFPIVDEDGNNAFLSGSVFHENFENWSADMDILFDEQMNGFSNNGKRFTGRFMVLNTEYQEGQVYYGKAYASGNANINIQKGTTEITVFATTEKGTKVDLPMYGTSDIDEFDFISFKEDTVTTDKNKINLSGVELNLNITATPDAAIRLIFNDKTGDQITATGQGDISLSVNQSNQIEMIGKYEIANGKYDFVLGPVKQQFVLEPGSNIAWTGSPYDANLSIRTYNSVNASLAEIDRGAISGGTDTKSLVKCILDITQTLSHPQINLDIDVPSANESGKAMLARIRSDKDELQKQFFTLLLLRRFAPINGEGGTQSLGGVADVITEQINSALDQMSKDVKLNVGYDGNAITGDKNLQFGVKTALGQKEKIILKTSFGVASSTSGNSNSSSLIGDMSLDYLFNPDGSFRLTIFNESNDKGVLSNKDKGDFTQGVGFHYQEDFNKIEDSRMIEFFKNIFRKNKEVKNSKKKDERPVEFVPGTPPPAPKKEED